MFDGGFPFSLGVTGGLSNPSTAVGHADAQSGGVTFGAMPGESVYWYLGAGILAGAVVGLLLSKRG